MRLATRGPFDTLAVNYTACAAMKSSRTQAADCTACDPGFYSSAAGQSTCTACSGGSATGQVSGATACSACLPGRKRKPAKGVPQLSARNLRDLERASVLPGLFSGFLRERYRQHILHQCPAGTAQPEALAENAPLVRMPTALRRRRAYTAGCHQDSRARRRVWLASPASNDFCRPTVV